MVGWVEVTKPNTRTRAVGFRYRETQPTIATYQPLNCLHCPSTSRPVSGAELQGPRSRSVHCSLFIVHCLLPALPFDFAASERSRTAGTA